MVPGRQCKFHAPLLPLAAHKLLQSHNIVHSTTHLASYCNFTYSYMPSFALFGHHTAAESPPSEKHYT